MTLTNYPPNACVAPLINGGQLETTYSPTYEMVVGVLQGDWWDASQIYRK